MADNIEELTAVASVTLQVRDRGGAVPPGSSVQPDPGAAGSGITYIGRYFRSAIDGDRWHGELMANGLFG
jgi:hypothetical protein